MLLILTKDHLSISPAGNIWQQTFICYGINKLSCRLWKRQSHHRSITNFI